jgi:hypothetical protein
MIYYIIRFEKEFQHYAIMCYVPLIGLCTYPKHDNNFSNILIAPDSSPFVKIALGIKTLEFYDSSNTIIKSTFFRAIVKYKWHAFARWRHFGIFLYYLINSCLFTAIVTINAMAINNTTETISDVAISAININRKLIILSIIFEIFQALFSFRCIFILLAMRLNVDSGIWLLNIISTCSIITEILEYKLLNLFLNFDVHEQFFIDDHVSWYLNILPYFRTVSTFMVWMGTFVFLCGLFKKIGLFLMGKV